MRQYVQWLCWRYEESDGAKPTKVPYDPKTGKHASVSNSETWATFEQAVEASKWYNGIGFVLTVNDPYIFTDLDDVSGKVALGLMTQAEADVIVARQLKIYQEFDSYSERSPSGKGLHIISKGSIPAGRKRACIELYSSLRYMTMTGDVFKDSAINERQAVATLLWEQMGGGAATSYYDGNAPELMKDGEIIGRAIRAANGDKFQTLLDGKWSEIYASQSEADLAFIDIIAFYTQNKKQISRLFAASALGKTPKPPYAHRSDRVDYVEYMIHKSFDRMLPPIDIEGLNNQLELKLAEDRETIAHNQPIVSPSLQLVLPGIPTQPQSTHLSNVPPGLVGDIARFIYAQAPRPVAEVALAGAIGLVAGICGRAYNISGMGLNQYVMLLAPTGIGKEAMASGIGKLMASIRTQVSASADFIGPGNIRSDAALLKWLAKTPCFLSIVGEFGLMLKQMSAHNASSHQTGLKMVLLDLYNKSGGTNPLNPMAYSDKEKNTAVIKGPSFTMLGESTPETFYEALDEGMITTGLLPRFTIIEYKGKRVPLNERHNEIVPDFKLIDALQTITTQTLVLMGSEKIIPVLMTPDVEKDLRKFNEFIDDQMNATERDVIRELWNRAHVKVLKLAATLAVGVNWFEPVITTEMAEWSKSLVVADIHNLLFRFMSGDVGKGNEEGRQWSLMKKCVGEFIERPYDEIAKYTQSCGKRLHELHIIPYVFLHRKMACMAAFKNDPRGATFSVKRTIQLLCESGAMNELNRKQIADYQLGTTQRCFVIAGALGWKEVTEK